MKILIVEDEADVRAVVSRSLTYAKSSYEPVEVADGDEALRLVTAQRPDLVILDLALPRRDGYSVLAEIRRRGDTPVIVLTARTREEERVRGLELGADDYVTKPFSPRELVARVEAVLRRARARPERHGTVDIGGLRVDLGARRAFRDGGEITLTPTEFNLLAELAANAGSAIDHETLLARVWGPEYRTETHYLKVYVNRLRDKVERDPANPRFIHTVRGVGYRFASATEAGAG